MEEKKEEKEVAEELFDEQPIIAYV